MSISPPSDLILDVARAVDPKRASAAAQKLALDSDTAAKDAFSSFVEGSGKHYAMTPPNGRNAMNGTVSHGSVRLNAKAADAKSDPVSAAYRALGSVLVEKMIETMMPNNKDGTSFGQGAAGSAWKSMMAEQLATHISGSIFKAPVSFAAHHKASPQETPLNSSPIIEDQNA